ncbi:MAG: hypothetical protein V3U94_02895 [Candidatus Thorarchaeota archaeon]
MKPAEIREVRWTVMADVRTETPEGATTTRGAPSFEVWACSAKEAHTKAKDILTVSWRGPTKVEISMGLCDSNGNYFSADENGIKEEK